jgi:hypothetical protein
MKAGMLTRYTCLQTCLVDVVYTNMHMYCRQIGSGVLVTPILEWDGKPVGNGEAGPVGLRLRQAVEHDMRTSPGLIKIPKKSCKTFRAIG